MINVSKLRADYGIDAPGVVRNLFLGSAAGFLLWGSAKLGWWSGTWIFHIGQETVDFGVADSGIGIGFALCFTALWMIWDSKVGKIRGRERLLQRLQWKGSEQVLDLGCGRGLLLIAAAKRLTTGKATGIDLWQSEDLSDNRPDATAENARREGVADRVDIQTGDMRKLPFADASFDYVVSRAAIHNLYEAGERAKAIAEVARVLKPGGQALIEDIRHGNEYAAVFAQHACSDAQFIGSKLAALLATLISMGSLRPATLLVTKR